MCDKKKKRVAFYYQTFTDQSHDLLNSLDPHCVTDLYLSSVHFGTDSDTGRPYIHLNDYSPQDFPNFLERVSQLPDSIRVHIMIGGAGGGLAPLCVDQETYLPLLRGFLACNPRITGINIDVEESGINEHRLEKLIVKLNYLYPDFEFAMAPILSPCTRHDQSEFDFATFVRSNASKYISTYCVQMYGVFSADALRTFICQFPTIDSSQVMLGTISGEFTKPSDLKKNYEQILQEFPDIQGIVNWELYGTPAWWAKTVLGCYNTLEETYYDFYVNNCSIL